MNYKQILYITLLVLVAFPLNAQRGQRGERQARNENLESLKVGFITKKLNLSPDQATTFWPLYNEMTEKIDEKKKQLKDKPNNFQNMSEADAKALILKRFEYEEEALRIKRDYFLKLAEKIGSPKVVKLRITENQFKRKLLKEMRNREGQRKNR